MEFKVLYWHWLVFGMLLIIAELFIPSFTVFWFGLGALIVALILWLLPDLTVSWQLFVWAMASIAFTVFWFKFFKPLMTDRTTLIFICNPNNPKQSWAKAVRLSRPRKGGDAAKSASPHRCSAPMNGPLFASRRWVPATACL